MSDYKVLWIEDELEKFIYQLGIFAEKHNIELTSYTSLEDAEPVLRGQFRDFSAVILDAHCPVKRGMRPQDDFLTQALTLIKSLSDAKSYEMPYYVYSAGTAKIEDFPSIIKQWVNSRPKEWGNFVYYKDESNVEDVFVKIAEVASSSPFAQVRTRYQSTFEVLEKGQRVENSDDVKNELMSILLELTFPGTNKQFEAKNYFNPLRIAVENLFRSANRYGLLPDDFITTTADTNQVHSNASSRYLAGIKTETPDKKRTLRYGEEGERVFPKVVADAIWAILQVTNPFSHSSDRDSDEEKDIRKFIEGNNTKEFLFSYTLQFCNVISWWGKYIANHMDVEANKAKCVEVKATAEAKDYEGKEFTPEQDEKGVWHCGKCEVTLKYWSGGKIRLKDVVSNGKDNSPYPYMAHYEKIH